MFRTPIGFHDAYVAAPSQKAALEAWGSDSNLFAQGVAEVVTDPELTKGPLERPGEVIRRLRGSEDEQVAALGKSGAEKAKAHRRSPSPSRSREGKNKKPPSRAAVDKAEKALEQAAARHAKALAALDAQRETLERRRREAERAQAEERKRLAKAAAEARERYRAAMQESRS